MAVIVMHPATRFARTETSSKAVGQRALVAFAAPVLAAALCWGMVDALAYTQSSLMQVYSAASSVTA